MRRLQPEPQGKAERLWACLLPDRRSGLGTIDTFSLSRAKEESHAEHRDRLKLILEYASEIRRFEIERLWQRSLFFWGPLLIAFGGYASFYDKHARAAIGAAGFGFVCSLAWTLQNRGGKYWQEAWEQKVEAVQLAVLWTPLFSNPEIAKGQGWLSGRRYSPSRLAIILSDYVTFGFVGIGYVAFRRADLTLDPAGRVDWGVVAIIASSVVFAGLLWSFGRSSALEPSEALERSPSLA